jgi:hypothetical protein
MSVLDFITNNVVKKQSILPYQLGPLNILPQVRKYNYGWADQQVRDHLEPGPEIRDVPQTKGYVGPSRVSDPLGGPEESRTGSIEVRPGPRPQPRSPQRNQAFEQWLERQAQSGPAASLNPNEIKRKATVSARRAARAEYQPGIRNLRQEIGTTVAQGDQAVADVGAWYKQAGQMAAKQRRIAGGETRNTKQNLRRAKVAGPGKGIGNAEMQIGAKAVSGLGKAGREFFSEITAATAAEGAASKTAVQRSFANQAAKLRGDLRSMKAEKRSAFRQTKSENMATLKEANQGMKGEVVSQASEIYNGYLQAVAGGARPNKTLKATLASIPNPRVRAQVARMALQNRKRGTERALAVSAASDGGSSSSEMTTEDMMNMHMKLAAANKDEFGAYTQQGAWHLDQANQLARMPRGVRMGQSK